MTLLRRVARIGNACRAEERQAAERNATAVSVGLCVSIVKKEHESNALFRQSKAKRP